jgi:ribosomal protein RSM22 (predicted rRNA methylase)
MSSTPSTPELTSLDRLLRFKPAIEDKRSKTWYADTSQEEVHDEDNDEDWGEYLDSDEDIDEQDPLLKVGKKLLQLGRVPYHHIEDMPQWFESSLAQVCSHRTSPQIRRCLQEWMVKTDRDVYAAYRSRRLYWREKGKDDEKAAPIAIRAYGPDEAVAFAHYFAPSYFGISRRVFREVQTILPHFQPKNMLDFGCGPGTAAAAAVDVWGDVDPEDADQSWREKKKGPRSAQAWRVENADKYKAENPTAKKSLSDMRYTGVDVSHAMIDAAKMVLKGTLPNVTLWDKIGDVVKRAHLTGERFDLINVSYTLSELQSDPTRRAAVLLLFELLDVGGALVIVENGSPVGSHTVRTARQLILDTFGTRAAAAAASAAHTSQDDKNSQAKGKDAKDASSGSSSSSRPALTVAEKTARMLSAPQGLQHSQVAASVVAPCTHDGECPLRKGFWCSFSQNVHSGKIKKGNEEKFSYVVLRKVAIGTASDATATQDREGVWTATGARTPEESNPSPLTVLRKAGHASSSSSSRREKDDVAALLRDVDWETYSPPLHREEWGRILRSPIKKKAHVIVDVCQPDATVSRSTLTKASIPKVPALYTALRKITWGGLFPTVGALSAAEDDDQQGAMHAQSRHSSFSLRQQNENEQAVRTKTATRGRSEEEDEEEEDDDISSFVSSRGAGRNERSSVTIASGNTKAKASAQAALSEVDRRALEKTAAKLFGVTVGGRKSGSAGPLDPALETGLDDELGQQLAKGRGGRRQTRSVQGQALRAHARRLGRGRSAEAGSDADEQ